MKSPEELAVSLLEADAGVAQLVEDRIYPVIAPASATMPFMTWRRVTVSREQTLGEPLGMPTITLAVDLYAESYTAVRELGDRVREVLNGWRGGMGDYMHVSLANLLTESDGFAQLAGGEMPPIYNVTQTWTILWQSE